MSFTNLSKSASLLLLAAVSASGFTQTPAGQADSRAAAALAEIRQIQVQIRQAISENRQPDPALQAKIKETAEKAVWGVNPQQVNLAKGKDWLELYSLAEDERSALVLAKRIYDQQTIERLDLTTRIVRGLISENKIKEARRHIRFTDFSGGPALIGQFHSGIRAQLANKAKTNLKEVLGLYDDLIARLRFGDHLTEGDNNWTPYAYADILSDKLTIIHGVGRTQEALNGFKQLEADLKKYPKSGNAHGGGALAMVESKLRRLTAEESQAGLIGRSAPSLLVDRHLNNFPGIESLKGKIVVLDFMAHWCGPCKAALPSLAQLQNDLGEKGVQVVSLTSFYGYYGTRQGISKDQEFELMKNFIKEFKIDWPLLFDSTGKNNFNFGVSGIPHLVVIDRGGIVRKIEVGFTPASFAETRKLIEQLAK